MAKGFPFHWPAVWRDAALVDLLKDTAIDCLFLDRGDDAGAVAERARREGIQLFDAGSRPRDVVVEKGEWPGVKLTESGVIDRATAGPTGVPWVDSNGWKIRLAAALHPGAEVWLESPPASRGLSAEAYQVAVADAAAHGAKWVISLHDELAAGIAERKPEAVEVWRKIAGAADFFARHSEWQDYVPAAVIGIISDFSGSNEPMGQELLNLIARTNQQYRIILKADVSSVSFAGLKALLYADEEPPGQVLRARVLDFIRAGGLLITGPKWGSLPGVPARRGEHPRYAFKIFGSGKVAIATPDFEDPYITANDSVILVSHRHDLLRFWNGGAVGSYMTRSPDARQVLVQMLFYALPYWGSPPTLRVAGMYRKAVFWALDSPDHRDIDIEAQKDAVELRLPRTPGYAALELQSVSGGTR